MSEQELTRRERHRRRTVAQIKAAAMAQVHEGGTEAMSLNAIARSMSMSTPALYRYFDSRDELPAELAVDAHLALARTLEAAASQGASPGSRARSVANAYRDWALAQPGAYRLAYESAQGSGIDHAVDRIGPAARRSMHVPLGVVAEVGEPPATPIPAALEKQILAGTTTSTAHRPMCCTSPSSGGVGCMAWSAWSWAGASPPPGSTPSCSTARRSRRCWATYCRHGATV
jgi:AcrR family transcriptional regulator